MLVSITSADAKIGLVLEMRRTASSISRVLAEPVTPPSPVPEEVSSTEHQATHWQ